MWTQKSGEPASDALASRVISLYEVHDIPVLLVLIDLGTGYCGTAESYERQLFLALSDIGYTKTKAQSPQTNGICERFYKTVLDEFYKIAPPKKIYRSLDELQVDLDE